MLRSRHAMLACAAAVLGLLCLAPAASASPPIPAPLNGTVSYPAGEVCPFPVRIDPGVNRDLLHILRDGRWIVTGHFIQTATNLATGKSLAIKSGGPLGVVFHDDGSLTFINHGSILWSNFPEDVDGPGLVVYTGHVVIELSPDGFATSVSRVPHQRDICAALA
jgi:hypothetical protein